MASWRCSNFDGFKDPKYQKDRWLLVKQVYCGIKNLPPTHKIVYCNLKGLGGVIIMLVTFFCLVIPTYYPLGLRFQIVWLMHNGLEYSIKGDLVSFNFYAPRFFSTAKGQLISKCPYSVIIWTKIPTKLFKDFCPSL